MTSWTIRRLLMLSLMALVATLGACAPGDEYGEAEDAAVAETGETDEYGGEEYGADEGLETEGYGTEEAGTGMAAAGEVDWGTWDEWDADANAELTRQEFDQGLQANLDLDGESDAEVTADEVSGDFWALVDADGDDRVAESEFSEGQERFQAGADWGTFADFDTDADGHLSRTEYDEWLNESAWDGVWDADDDGVVGQDEVADTYWDWFDLNDDDRVDQTEFDQATA